MERSPRDSDSHAAADVEGLRPPCVHSPDTGEAEQSEPECWICRDSSSTADNPMVRDRCLCVGSIGFVHQACIDAWVLENNHLICLGCGTAYRIKSMGLPEGVSYPTTVWGRVRVVTSLVVLPLFQLILGVILRFLVFWVCEPLLLGCVLFWQRFVHSGRHREPSVPAHEVPAASWAWDSLDVIIYGLALVNLLRAFRKGYWSWIEFFGWPAPPEAFEGVDDIDLHLSSDSDGEADADEDVFSDDDDGAADWVTSSDGDEAEDDEAGDVEAGDDEAGDVEPDGAAPPEAPPPAPHDQQQGTTRSQVNKTWWLFHSVRRFRKSLGMHRSWPALWKCALRELVVGIPISFCLGSMLTAAALAAATVGLFVYWRCTQDRKRLRDATRRYDEAGERKSESTEVDARRWFRTYFTEVLLFSVCLPMVAGAVAHYAVSPYFAPFPTSVDAFMSTMRPLQLLIYWALGSMGAFALMQIEALVMVPLFAPGVDLLFIRSIDLQFTVDTDYWRFILTQVFDADPLLILYDFVRMACIESLVLFLFLRLPAMFIYHSSNTLAAALHREPRVLAPPIGVPVHVNEGSSGYIFVRALLECVALRPLGFTEPSQILRVVGHMTLRVVLTVWAFASIMLTIGFVRIQRLQLLVLRPFALFVGRHIVHLEDFLFDKERMTLVDAFLAANDVDRLVMPMIPEADVFRRRHVALPKERIPSRLALRLVVFAVLFFIYSATVFWLVPAVVFSLLAAFVSESFTVLFVGVIAVGCIIDVKTMATTVIPLSLCIPLLLAYALFLVATTLFSLLAVGLDSRAREAIDHHYKVRQTVAAFASGEAELPHEPESNVPSDQDSQNHDAADSVDSTFH